MWRRVDFHPATALGLVAGAVFVLLLVAGVTMLFVALWAVLSLMTVLYVRRGLDRL